MNGYCESFNGKLRDECLNGEIFYNLREVQVIIEKWRIHYNTKRPHSALGYCYRTGLSRNARRQRILRNISVDPESSRID